MIVAVALAVAGCGASTTPAAPSNAAAPTTSSETGAESAPSTGTTTGDSGLSAWKQAFKFDRLNWYTYTKSGSGDHVNVAYANETYKGVAARKVTTYFGSTEPLPKLQDSYLDAATGEFLAGTQYLGGVAMEMSASDFDSVSNDVYSGFDIGNEPSTTTASR